MRLTPKRRPWQPDHRLVRLLLLILLSKISKPAHCLALDNDVDDDGNGDNVIGTTSNFSDGVLGTFETEAAFRVPSDVDECSPCLCKWSGGKQTAECAGVQLVEVPQGLRAETQVREPD